MPAKKILRPYQRDALRYSIAERNPKFFIDMRLGKCLITLRSISLRRQRDPVLIIAPFSAWDGWEADLGAEGVVPTLIEGSAAKRRETLLKPLSGYYITNPEIWRSVPEIALLPWRVRVCDESTFLKNPTAKVTKFINDPRTWPELAHDYKLTGTPDPESLLDYYGQTADIWEERNFWAWRTKWFIPYDYGWQVRPRLRNIFHAHLKKHCFFLSRADVGMGGQKVYEKRFIALPTNVQKIYKQLASEFILKMDGRKFETLFAGVKYSWLRRLCGGLIPTEDGGAREIWGGKIEELVHVVTGELKREPVVIYAHFVEEVERIAVRLRHLGKVSVVHGDVPMKKRGAIIKEFQSGATRWLVAQPQTVAYGKDFSRADTIIYYSTPESKLVRDQSETRTTAAMKKTPSLIIDLIVKGSIEEEIAAGREAKESRIETTRRILRHFQSAGLIRGKENPLRNGASQVNVIQRKQRN